MREKNSSALVLQIGTTKLLALRASVRPDQSIQVEAWQRKDPRGFEGGLARDAETAIAEVREILEAVSGEKGFYEYPLYVIVSNSEIRNYQFSSSIYFQNTRPITEQDVQDVIAQTRSVATIPLDEMILKTVPQEFLVNDLPEIRNPVGLEGRRISVTLHLFTLPVTAHRGLTNVFDNLEIEPDLIVPRGLMTGQAVLQEDEKREGVLLWDVGGTLSELFYYYKGSLRSAKVVPWGSEEITERIARRWEIPPKDARRLKEEMGTLEAVSALPDENVTLMEPSGRVRLKIPFREFQEEILRAAQEGMEVFEKEIREIRQRFPHIYQLVFSGGMTRTHGFLESVQSRLSIPARLGFVSGIHGPQELLSHPSSNAVLGLLKQMASTDLEEKGRRDNGGFLSKTVGQFKGWLQDYF